MDVENLPIQVKALLLPCSQQLEQTRRHCYQFDASPFPLNPIHPGAMVRICSCGALHLGSCLTLTGEGIYMMQLDVGKVVSLAQP